MSLSASQPHFIPHSICSTVALLVLALTSLMPDAKAARGTPPWGLNDVSILLPIAERHSPDLLLSASSEGVSGPLLPRAVQTRIGRIHSFEQAEETYARLRVVSIRIDPCFPGGSDLRSCIPQVRMVWQPISEIRNQTLIASDAAIHTFYSLSRAEFERLLQDLDRLRAQHQARLRSPSYVGRLKRVQGNLAYLPLSVHPIIAAEGLRGPYYAQLRKIFLSHIGERHLTRATFMKLSRASTMWDFGGFDIVNGRFTAMGIPRTDKNRQAFINNAIGDQTEFSDSGIFPAPSDSLPNVNLISSDSKIVRAKARPEALARNVRDAARIENPRVFKTPQLDCVSCHVALSSRTWAVSAFPELNLQAQVARFAYRSSTGLPLKNISRGAGFTANMRAFGYFDTLPAISQRTIHESAEVAEALNRRR